MKKTKKIEIILDNHVYKTQLVSIGDALKDRGFNVEYSNIMHSSPDADLYIVQQDIGLIGCPRPILFVPHGYPFSKRNEYNYDIDAIAFSGDYIASDTIETIGKDVIIFKDIGSCEILDLLKISGNKLEIQNRVRKTHGFDMKPIVGYAPTYKNMQLYGHDDRVCTISEVECALSKEYNLLVLPHPLELQSELVGVKSLLSSEISREEYLVSFDCVVTDNSSLAFKLCALDTPLVLLNNPNVSDYLTAKYVKNKPTMDYGIHSLSDDLQKNVNAAIKDSSLNQNNRKKWTQIIFGPNVNDSKNLLVDMVNEIIIKAPSKKFTGGIHMKHTDFIRDLRAFNFLKLNSDAKLKNNLIQICLESNCEPKILIYGPYFKLPKGKYTVTVKAYFDINQCINLSIDAMKYPQVHKAVDLISGKNTSIEFVVDEDNSDALFEFIIKSKNKSNKRSCVDVRVFQLFKK